jgi:hypothetical protein
LKKFQGKESMNYIKGGNDIHGGIFKFVGQQTKNGYLEGIILNIPNCLKISGGCQSQINL